MSTLEVEELCRILSALNYRRQQVTVTPDAFQLPNFMLIVDILEWMMKILDENFEERDLALRFPDRKLSSLTQSAIVNYFSNIGRLVYALFEIQLDLVQLIKADQNCCPELLKLARPIFEAAELAIKVAATSDDTTLPTVLNTKREKIDESLELISQETEVRDLAIEIDKLCLTLDGLLAKEDLFNEARLRILDKSFDSSEVIKILHDARADLLKEIDELVTHNAELEEDLARLDKKLEFKHQEVSTSEDRLNDLLTQLPAYSIQFEKLYQEFVSEYESYVTKHRNLTYLEYRVYSNSEDSAGGGIEGAENQVVQLEKEESLSVDSPRALGGGGRELAESVTTGPARLLESLFDGASKPISASLMVDEAGAGAGVGATGANESGLALEGGTGRRTALVYTGLPATAGDVTGLELEGLLREFVGDSTTGTTYEDDEAAGMEPSEAGTITDDEDEEDTELADGLNGAY